MGLFNRLSGLLQRLGQDPADDGIAEHTVTLAQEAQQQQQFLGMRAELLDYVRACIDVLSQEQRAELTETVGGDWQTVLRNKYRIDARLDERIRGDWHARLVAARNPQLDPESFLAWTFRQYFNDRVNQCMVAPAERSPAATVESQQRKLRSHRRLRAARVPVNGELPVMESSHEVALRDAQLVRKRALVLTWVARAHDAAWSGLSILEMLSDRDALDELTPAERGLLTTRRLTDEQRVTLLEKLEAAQTLLWALGELPLPPPDRRCPPGRAFTAANRLVAMMGRPSPPPLRPLGEILDEWDYAYRYHWAVKDAILQGQLPASERGPGSLILHTSPAWMDAQKRQRGPLRNGALPMVVAMRHLALNWLVGYRNIQDWDSVSTDT